MSELSPLRQARADRNWSQSQLIAAMLRAATSLGIRLPGPESIKTNIRRWERGEVVPGDEYRRVLRAVYGLTDDELGLGPLDGAIEASGAPAWSSEGVAYHAALLQAHVAADNRLGPAVVQAVVAHQAREIDRAIRHAPRAMRAELVRLAVDLHEFDGWVQQDLGRTERAMAATSRASDLAMELNSEATSAYLLMRRSNIASDAGDIHLAASLAEAALRTAPASVARLRSVILRQQANAYAALGDADRCAAAIDLSFDEIRSADGDAEEFASYCTSGYLAMEAIGCWTTLDQPRRAFEIVDEVAEWPDELRRDNGLALARAANALAQAGDVDQALANGRLAVRIADKTRSRRTVAELRRLRDTLRLMPGDEADNLRRSITSLMSATV